MIPTTMKEVPNKRFNENDTAVSLLTICLNNPGERGLDLVTIRARNRVFDAMEGVKEGDVIKLEDADMTVAQDAVRAARWAKPLKIYIQFAELFGL